MDPYEFEEFVADLWEARGWNARVTQGSADRGVDVVATQADPFSKKYVIQAKRYANTVSSPEIQQYASLRQQEVDVDAVVIVTTGEFSSQAKSVARDLNVKRVNIDDLYELVTSNGGREVYDDYFGEPGDHTGPNAPVTKQWQFNTFGELYMSPAIADDTIYVGSIDYDFSSKENSLYAVDAATGDQEWQFDAVGLVPKSTVVDNTVYVGSRESLHAVDAATGDQEWQFDTDTTHTYPESTVVDDTIYVGGIRSSANLYAVDANTGTKQWQFDNSRGVSKSPAVMDGTVCFVSSANLYAVDAVTGDQQWQFNPDEKLESSPVVVDGTVYAALGTTLYAVDAATGNQEWQLAAGRYKNQPVVVDDIVYVGSKESLHAVDAVTGSKRWQFNTDSSVESSGTVTDGTVYFVSNDNSLYAVDAATGNQEWQFAAGGTSNSSLTVVDGTVYVGLDNTLYAVDAATGDQEWQFDTDTHPKSPVVVDDTIYVGIGDEDMSLCAVGEDR